LADFAGACAGESANTVYSLRASSFAPGATAARVSVPA
jgi:hypothetical protein